MKIGTISNPIPENEARRKLERKINEYLAAVNNIEEDIFENMIRKQIDELDLNISNFYRLRKYLRDEFKPYIKKSKFKKPKTFVPTTEVTA